MLKLTKKADYGLISLKHLAMKGGSASAKEIADAYGIPLPLLSKRFQLGNERPAEKSLVGAAAD